MITPPFLHTRAFAVIAVGVSAVVAAAAVYFLVASPPAVQVAAPRPAAIPAPETAPETLATVPATVNMQTRTAPPPLPRPAAEPDLASVFPPSRLPDVATAQGARVSLGCLARNGADLSRPMPSKHRVFAADEKVAGRLRAWAAANGFQVTGEEMVREHVGTPRWRLDLVRVEVPDPDAIEREGRLVLAAVRQIPGTYYQTWSGEIVR